MTDRDTQTDTGYQAGGVTIPEHVARLQPYRPGKPIDELARERGLTRIVKLASNENPLGPSPGALAGIQQALTQLHRYVDPGTPALVQALAERHHRSPRQIVCGHGTDSLLAAAVNAFMDRDDELLTSRGTFIGIYVSTAKLGHRLRAIPLKEYAFDLGAMAEAVGDHTKMVYLANPNNPTGTMFTATEFERFMAQVPPHVLVILDEAYDSYAREYPGYPDGLAYDYPNLIVTRTLSKVYGLGGLRVGYAVGPEPLISQIYKVRMPFEPNVLAQAAALGALKDEAFVRLTVDTNRRNLARMAQEFGRMHIPFVPSVANFLMLLMPSEDLAGALYEECLSRGLIVRPVASFGVPCGIRVNSGTDDETAFAIEVIGEVYPRLLATHPTDKG